MAKRLGTPPARRFASAWYDNSPASKSNPDATKRVWWGDQTWEEMMFTNLTFHMPTLSAQTAGQK